MSDVEPGRPDWKRLGVAFGERDVCVEFPFPARVLARRQDVVTPLAERVVALREGPDGIALQVECGLFLHVAGARLASLSEAIDEALVDLGPFVRTLRPKARSEARTGREDPLP